MPRYLPCFVLAVGLVLFPGCDLLSSSPPPSFDGPLLPLTSGNHWSLVAAYAPDSLAPDTTRLRVLSTVEVNGQTYHALHGLSGDEAMLLREGEHGHIYQRQGGRDVLWFDPSVGGDSTYVFRGFVVTVSSLDSVKTPAGTFADCLRFSFNIPEAVDDEHSYTLKPGVGFVRRWGAWIGSWELTSYTVSEDS